MIKIIFTLLTFIVAAALGACNHKDTIEGYKSHEILVVTLEVADDSKIEKVILNSSYRHFNDSVFGSTIEDKSAIKLKCPQISEGTFSICVYTNKDTLCSDDYYIEGGYRPRLRLKNNKFETLNSDQYTE